MGEHQRLTPSARAAHAAAAQADAVEALVHIGRRHLRGMSPDQMAPVLGTVMGIFAAAASCGERAFVARVDEVARDIIEQAQEAA